MGNFGYGRGTLSNTTGSMGNIHVKYYTHQTLNRNVILLTIKVSKETEVDILSGLVNFPDFPAIPT